MRQSGSVRSRSGSTGSWQTSHTPNVPASSRSSAASTSPSSRSDFLGGALGAGSGRGQARPLGNVHLKTAAALLELLAEDGIERSGQGRTLVCMRDGAHRQPSCAAFLRSAICPAW